MEPTKVYLNTSKVSKIEKIIAVASGKGGVGKSTVAVNLALALANKGKKVGILDADIYGPNVPLMLGLNDVNAKVEDGYLIPVQKFGLHVMSVGFISPEDKALIWRGPLANKLVEQFLNDVDWPELDILVIDLPPGTGDVPLSIIQKANLTAGIVVTTPQEASIADVKKMINMFEVTKVNVLGIVENMKYVVCPSSDEKVELYPNDEGKSISEILGKELLEEFPFEPGIGLKKNNEPYFIYKKDSEIVNKYLNLAEKVINS